MSAFLLTLLSSALNAVLPVLVAFIQKLIPTPAVSGATKEQHRATVRQWVVGLLSEIGGVLVSKGVVPAWLTPELPVIEGLVASALDSALDSAGL